MGMISCGITGKILGPPAKHQQDHHEQNVPYSDGFSTCYPDCLIAVHVRPCLNGVLQLNMTGTYEKPPCNATDEGRCNIPEYA